MLLNGLQCIGQPRTVRNVLAANVNSDKLRTLLGAEMNHPVGTASQTKPCGKLDCDSRVPWRVELSHEVGTPSWALAVPSISPARHSEGATGLAPSR